MGGAEFRQETVKVRQGEPVARDDAAAVEQSRRSPACGPPVAARPTLRDALARVFGGVAPPPDLRDRIRAFMGGPADEPRPAEDGSESQGADAVDELLGATGSMPDAATDGRWAPPGTGGEYG